MSKTRAGTVYKSDKTVIKVTSQRSCELIQKEMDEGEPHQAATTSGEKDEIIRLLLEDKKRQDEQMERLMRMLESTHASQLYHAISMCQDEPKIAKLMDSDHIEVYLTTFE